MLEQLIFINSSPFCQVPDEAVSKCTACGSAFNAFVRKACLVLTY